MTNKEFCYWLQGFFEISKSPSFTSERVAIIRVTLKSITEPLGFFTSWLLKIIVFLEEDYDQVFADYLCPEVGGQLNALFYHVIDNTYDTPFTPERKKIHDGVTSNVE